MKNKTEIQNEALKVLLPLKRAGAGITVGGGKTLLGLKHMNHNYTDYARFLVVAPKITIFDEWLKQADEHSLSHLKDHIKFTTYLSLDKQDLDYDVIYLDECHSLLYSMDSYLSKFNGKILGLTGTPPRHITSEKGKMVAKYCPIVYTYTTDEAIENEILNDYKIIIHYLSLSNAKDMEVKKGNKTWYTSEQASYNYWTQRIENAVGFKELAIMRIMRMKAMMTFKSKENLALNLLNSINNKVILFANTQEQADRLCTHSFHANNSLSEDNLEKFKKGDITEVVYNRENNTITSQIQF